MKRLYTLLLMVSCFYNASAQIPDWSNSVAAIIYDNCTGCHRPGEIGPFSLTNYLEASDYAFSIQSAVNAKVMPPWSPDANYVHFTGERILSETQIATINDWVNAGTPEGNPDLAPPLPSFTDGSQLGIPDLVLEMSEVLYYAWKWSG
jgi:mono/diheme cytochrome c family protein